MKTKLIILIGLILTGWAAWTHITSGFNAKEVQSALFLITAYAVSVVVINAWCSRTARLMAPAMTSWFAGTCVVYTPLVSCNHRWLQEFASVWHVNQEIAMKIAYIFCMTVIMVCVNVAISIVSNLLSKQNRRTKEFALIQTIILLMFAYNVSVVIWDNHTRKNTALAKVSRAAVAVIRQASVEKTEASETPREIEIRESSSPQAKKLPKFISANFDVRLRDQSADETSAEEIDKHLGGVLKGKGEVFVKVGKKYKINPLFLASIAMHESDNGKSRPARECNNPLGIMCGKDAKEHRTFASVDEAIEFTAKQLANSGHYVRKGNCTVQEIQKVYCPVKAKNDPKKLNKYWLSGVLAWMNKIHKAAEKPELAPRTVALN